MTVVLVYARASSDPNDQRISVDRQVKLCTARAAESWPDAIVKVFRDDDISGGDPNIHRPGFADFLNAVRSARRGNIAGVVVNEQNRLTRQGTGAWDELCITLTKAGLTEVLTLRNGPVSVVPGNRLVGRLLAVIDQEELERIKARTQDAHRELFNEGRPSGRAPYGYRMTKDDKGRAAFELHPDEAPIVKQVFAWALAGHAISAIVERLNAQGIPPISARFRYKDKRQVKAWQPATVRSVLVSPTVAGLRVHVDADGVRHSVPAQWPAVIDADQWQQVQRLLNQPALVLGLDGKSYRVRTAPGPKPRRWLLSGGRRRGGEVYGVLLCGGCGFPLVAQPQHRGGKGPVPAYQCSPAKTSPAACGGVSISPADRVDALVVDAIQRRLAESPGLRQRLERSVDAEAAKWRQERDAAKGRMLRAAELFGTRAIDEDTFHVMHNPAKAAFDLAEDRLASMVASDMALPSVDDVVKRWDRLTLKQRRAVVERLIGSIVIAPGTSGRPGFNVDRVGEPDWLA